MKITFNLFDSELEFDFNKKYWTYQFRTNSLTLDTFGSLQKMHFARSMDHLARFRKMIDNLSKTAEQIVLVECYLANGLEGFPGLPVPHKI